MADLEVVADLDSASCQRDGNTVQTTFSFSPFRMTVFPDGAYDVGLVCSVLVCSVLVCFVLVCSVLVCSVLVCSVLVCSVLVCVIKPTCDKANM